MHHLVAAYLEYKPRAKAGAATNVDQDVGPLIAALGGELPIVKGSAVDSSAFEAWENERSRNGGQ